MNRSTKRSLEWVFYLTAVLLFIGVLIRSVLIFSGSAYLPQVLGLLSAWLALAASETFISKRVRYYFLLYLVCQTTLVFVLINTPDFEDFFAALLIIISMQVMIRLNPKAGFAWMGLCALIMVLVMFRTYQSQAVALALIYTGANILFGSYTLAARRSQEARLQNESLAKQLQEANNDLNALSVQREEIALMKERSRLARDMHDSVTQTVFSMSLAAQSAQLMLAREPASVENQLKRIGNLSQRALSEMKLLVSELNLQRVTTGGLAASLRHYVQVHSFPENFRVDIYTEGNDVLSSIEEEALFRIALEGLNNIMKHARTSEATIRLHLIEPFSLEIEDKGQGFEPDKSVRSGMGLKNMQEQAKEIGWTMTIFSSLGKGTRIRVEKSLS
jgi:signal transduction histidine kinase